jgi:hypothetical protein
MRQYTCVKSRTAFLDALCDAIIDELGDNTARRPSESRQHVIFRIENGNTSGTGRLMQVSLPAIQTTGSSDLSTYRVSLHYLDSLLSSRPEDPDCTHEGEAKFEDASCYFARIWDVRGPVPSNTRSTFSSKARVHAYYPSEKISETEP